MHVEDRTTVRAPFSGGRTIRAAAYVAVTMAVSIGPVSVARATPATDQIGQPVGTNRLVSARPDGSPTTRTSDDPAISANGRYVTFFSEDRGLLGEANPCCQVYLTDWATRETSLISRAPGGEPADNDAAGPSISADAGRIAYWSSATNLVADDDNGTRDVFVYDATAGRSVLISRTPTGQPADGPSFNPSISADGTRVAYQSDATNLVPGDTNRATDVFVWDAVTGRTTMITRARTGGPANSASYSPALSADGRRVAYVSVASDLVRGDRNQSDDVFVSTVGRTWTRLVSRSSDDERADGGSFNPAISADGNRIAFWSFAGNLDADDTNAAGDVYVRDMAAGRTILVSVNSNGTVGNGESDDPSISGDGRLVSWQSLASNLVAGDANASADVFLRDLDAGTTALVSRTPAGVPADGPSLRPAISLDGSHIAYQSIAGNLVPTDPNGQTDVFVFRRA